MSCSEQLTAVVTVGVMVFEAGTVREGEREGVTVGGFDRGLGARGGKGRATDGGPGPGRGRGGGPGGGGARPRWSALDEGPQRGGYTGVTA